MLYQQFFDQCHTLLNTLQEQEQSNIQKAAQLIADAVSKGNYFFIYDRGHLLSNELIARAGGVAFARQINYALPSGMMGGMAGMRAANLAKNTDRLEEQHHFEEAYIREIFSANGIGKGDVILLNSVSGTGFTISTFAQIAEELEVKIIVMTSMATCPRLKPAGSKYFYEYGDVVLDNHAPFGDATICVDGLPEKILPLSGVAAAFLGWAVVATAVELLLAQGVVPTVYRSVSLEGGSQQNAEAIERYNQLGY